MKDRISGEFIRYEDGYCAFVPDPAKANPLIDAVMISFNENKYPARMDFIPCKGCSFKYDGQFFYTDGSRSLKEIYDAREKE